MNLGKKPLIITIVALFLLNIIVITVGRHTWRENSRKLAQRQGNSQTIHEGFEQEEVGDENPQSDSENTESEDTLEPNEVETEDTYNNEETEDQEPQQTVAEKSGIITVSKTMYTTTGVIVRKDATTESDRIGGYAADETVAATGEVNNGWIQIDYNGQTGYILGTFLTETKPQVNAPTPPPSQPTNPGNGNGNGQGTGGSETQPPGEDNSDDDDNSEENGDNGEDESGSGE